MVCNISAEAKYIYLMASDPSDGGQIHLFDGFRPLRRDQIHLFDSFRPLRRVKKIVLACSAFFHRSLYCRAKFPCSFRQTWRLVSNSFNCLALSDDNSANLQHYFEKRNITESFFCGEPCAMSCFQWHADVADATDFRRYL